MNLDPSKWEYDIPVAEHIRIEVEVSGRVHHKYHVGEIALKCIKCGNVVPLSPCSTAARLPMSREDQQIEQLVYFVPNVKLDSAIGLAQNVELGT